MREDEGFAECECPTKCNLRYEPVCGNNGKSYENKCAMKLESCRTGKWIKVEKKGTCGKKFTKGKKLKQMGK